MIVSNNFDALHISLRTKTETDLDSIFNVSNIKEVMYDQKDNIFYFLANKMYDALGLFLLKIDADNPNNFHFITRWKNKLDIGDTNLFVIRNKEKATKS